MKLTRWLPWIALGLGCGGKVASTAPANSNGDDSATPDNEDASTFSDDASGIEPEIDVAVIPGIDASLEDDATMDAPSVDAASCGSPPTLHLELPGTIFCGFGADGGLLTCDVGEECCLGGALGGGMYAAQVCQATGSTCTLGTGPIPIACNQGADCTANGVGGAVACCLQGAKGPAPKPGCTYPAAQDGTAVACETSGPAPGPGVCAAGEIQICESQADCPTGTTCVPGKWKIFQVGFCM
jgi:hypothetical protein